jgi:hypothetical protein
MVMFAERKEQRSDVRLSSFYNDRDEIVDKQQWETNKDNASQQRSGRHPQKPLEVPIVKVKDTLVMRSSACTTYLQMIQKNEYCDLSQSFEKVDKKFFEIGFCI